jgi:hypothetical protein
VKAVTLSCQLAATSNLTRTVRIFFQFSNSCNAHFSDLVFLSLSLSLCLCLCRHGVQHCLNKYVSVVCNARACQVQSTLTSLLISICTVGSIKLLESSFGGPDGGDLLYASGDGVTGNTRLVGTSSPLQPAKLSFCRLTDCRAPLTLRPVVGDASGVCVFKPFRVFCFVLAKAHARAYLHLRTHAPHAQTRCRASDRRIVRLTVARLPSVVTKPSRPLAPARLREKPVRRAGRVCRRVSVFSPAACSDAACAWVRATVPMCVATLRSVTKHVQLLTCFDDASEKS